MCTAVFARPGHAFHLFMCPSCRCPDAVNFRIKPVIGATYQRLKDKLQGLGKDIQASGVDELVYEKIRADL